MRIVVWEAEPAPIAACAELADTEPVTVSVAPELTIALELADALTSPTVFTVPPEQLRAGQLEAFPPVSAPVMVAVPPEIFMP